MLTGMRIVVTTARSLYLLLPIALASTPARSDGQAVPQARFTPGVYYALPRDSTAITRFRRVEFDFLPNGALIWRRGSTVEQVMAWRAADDVFEVEESVGCSIAPRGTYRVAPWLDGFALQAMQDGCTNRAAALNEIYLVPRGRLVTR
jgi:hypothetical protein